MAEGVSVFQRAKAVAFSLRVMQADHGVEYEISDVADGVGATDVAEVLFSIALDVRAKGESGLSL